MLLLLLLELLLLLVVELLVRQSGGRSHGRYGDILEFGVSGSCPLNEPEALCPDVEG